MKRPFLRSVISKVGKWFGVHPEVGDLISGGFRLTNPDDADLPSENLTFASRLIASGIWNYCFFQFYRNFVGPYWVERQYNPKDVSFIPRAVSPLSINVTHRTWMGFRGPASAHFALMDPAGAISPVAGYYSLEFAFIEKGRLLLPARGELKVQPRAHKNLPIAECRFSSKRTKLRLTCSGTGENLILFVLNYESSEPDTEIVISIRPFNPEGATLLHDIAVAATASGQTVAINGEEEIFLPEPPQRMVLSQLRDGDAYFSQLQARQVHCPYGIATGTIHYRAEGSGQITFAARTYERKDANGESKPVRTPQTLPAISRTFITHSLAESRARWKTDVRRGARFVSARRNLNRAAQTMAGYLLSLQTGNEITPGAYTYRTFFFRDAAYMVSALLRWNYIHEATKVIKSYSGRQLRDGFFRSQKGEWDGTGQAIWTLMQYVSATNDRAFLESIYPHLTRGVRWIWRLRRKGLRKKILPPGFSAEHLGPADSYYWDNIWSIAGLHATAQAAERLGLRADAARFWQMTNEYTSGLLEVSESERRKLGLITAAPGRQIETGMIGSVCVMYPLEMNIFPKQQVRKTVNTIYKRFFNRGLFFHHIIHSGYNIYLSLQVAQCLFRLGEIRKSRRILNRALKMSSPMWTYPEAIHPLTGGGVMGDGFHGWAFAEILLLLREFTISRTAEQVEVFQGLRKRELFGRPFEFGPFPLDGTQVTVTGQMNGQGGHLHLHCHRLHGTPIAKMRLHLPGSAGVKIDKVHGVKRAAGKANKLILLEPETEVEIKFSRIDQ